MHIQASDLSKHYRIYHKHAGLIASIQSLIVRKFENKTALNSFDIEVKQGEIIGLLGPNGAGKTTFMKMCTGIIQPSSGELSVLGENPFRRSHEFRKSIALVMGQKSQLWWDLPAIDSLKLLQQYYELTHEEFDSRLHLLTEKLHVQDLLSLHVRKLSLGERMKMELLACLLHNPKIIFLDEPTIGLDIVAQNNIREFLKDYHKQHDCTIILTSHYMADVDALCERIVLLLDGKKNFDGTRDDFENLLGKEKFICFWFSRPVNVRDELWGDYESSFFDNNTRVEMRIPSEELREVSAEVLRKYSVIDFQSEKIPIERVLSSLMQKQ